MKKYTMTRTQSKTPDFLYGKESGHDVLVPFDAIDDIRGNNNIEDLLSGASGGIGTIAYFPSSPGPKWLKCDGKSYLRSAYPQYEAQRPDPAFVVELVPGVNPWSSPPVSEYSYNSYKTPTGATLARSPAGVYVRASSDFTVVTNTALIGGPYGFSALPSGRIIAIPPVSKTATSTSWYSDDDGLTWVSTPGAVPAIASAVAATTYFNYVTTFNAVPGGVVALPVPRSTTVLRTVDGITWTTFELAADRYGGIPKIPNYTIIRPEIGFNNWAYLLDAEPTVPAAWEFRANSMAAPTAGLYEIRPGMISSFASQGGKNYVTIPFLGVFVEDVSATIAGFPNPHPQKMASAIQVVDRVFFTNGYGFYSGADHVGWLSPDRSSVEVAKTLDVVGTGAVNYMYYDGWERAAHFTRPDRTHIAMHTASYGSAVVVSFSLDSTKFHAPGLSSIGGVHPYVKVAS